MQTRNKCKAKNHSQQGLCHCNKWDQILLSYKTHALTTRQPDAPPPSLQFIPACFCFAIFLANGCNLNLVHSPLMMFCFVRLRRRFPNTHSHVHVGCVVRDVPGHTVLCDWLSSLFPDRNTRQCEPRGLRPPLCTLRTTPAV